MNKTLALTCCLLLTNFLLLAQKHTIFGNILDIENGEHLIGATVLAEDKNVGSSSNNYGFYSLTLPGGPYNISFSFIGYKTNSYHINLSSDTTLNVGLKSEITTLNEVIVEAKENNIVFNNQMGSHSLNLKTIKLAPAAVGEVDLIKNLQLLPGIQTANEGTTNLSVRGGSFDQNLFLLDDAPIYNPSHALGFFSTFNPDAISSVKIYKTAFPAQYGGRLSSIIDIRMKEVIVKIGLKGILNDSGIDFNHFSFVSYIIPNGDSVNISSVIYSYDKNDMVRHFTIFLKNPVYYQMGLKESGYESLSKPTIYKLNISNFKFR